MTPSKNPSNKRQNFSVGPNDDGKRLDNIVRRLLPVLGLSALAKAVREGDVKLNDKKTTPEARVRSGDEISIWKGLVDKGTSKRLGKAIELPDDFERWIVFRSEDYVVVNKPQGVLVHAMDDEEKPETPPLDDLVRAYLSKTPTQDLVFRPGPLHRLDRPTSGLVVFSASIRGAREFSQLLHGRKVRKLYLAIVEGAVEKTLEIESDFVRSEESMKSFATRKTEEKSNASRTTFSPLATRPDASFVLIEITGGKTHQIRVHANAVGHPLRGDRKYGSRTASPPWFLHAYSIDIPRDGEEALRFVAPLPLSFFAQLSELFGLDASEAENTVRSAIASSHAE